MADRLIETSISRDVLLLTRVDKPVLLRRLFELACRYSGQVLSFTKMLGQLQDAGNTTTLAHYLELLAGAGMVCGLPKYAGDAARSRGSSPKLQVLNTALMGATSGLVLDSARADREFWGRLVESAVGAHLVNAAAAGLCTVSYCGRRRRTARGVPRAAGRAVGRTLIANGQRRFILPDSMATFRLVAGSSRETWPKNGSIRGISENSTLTRFLLARVSLRGTQRLQGIAPAPSRQTPSARRRARPGPPVARIPG